MPPNKAFELDFDSRIESLEELNQDRILPALTSLQEQMAFVRGDMSEIKVAINQMSSKVTEDRIMMVQKDATRDAALQRLQEAELERRKRKGMYIKAALGVLSTIIAAALLILLGIGK